MLTITADGRVITPVENVTGGDMTFAADGRRLTPVVVIDPATMRDGFTADGRFVMPTMAIDPTTGLPVSGGGGTGDRFATTSGSVPSNSLPGTAIIASLGPTITGTLALVDDAYADVAPSGSGLVVGAEPPVIGDGSPINPIVQVTSADGTQALRKPITITITPLTVSLNALTPSNTSFFSGLGKGYTICTFAGRWNHPSATPSRFRLTSDTAGTLYTGTLCTIEDAALDYKQSQNVTVDETLTLLTGTTPISAGSSPLAGIYLEEDAGGSKRYTSLASLTCVAATAPTSLTSSAGATPTVAEFAAPMSTYITTLGATFAGNDYPTWYVDTTFGDGALGAFDVESWTGRVYVTGDLARATKATYSIKFVCKGITGLATSTITLTVGITAWNPANLTDAAIGTTLVERIDATIGANVSTSGSNIVIVTGVNGTVFTASATAPTYTSGATPSFNFAGTGGISVASGPLLNLFGAFPTTTYGSQPSAPFFAAFVIKSAAAAGVLAAVYSTEGGYDVSRLYAGTDRTALGPTNMTALTSGAYTVLIFNYTAGSAGIGSFQNGVGAGRAWAVTNVNVLRPTSFTIGNRQPADTSGGFSGQIVDALFGTGTLTLEQIGRIGRWAKGKDAALTATQTAIGPLSLVGKSLPFGAGVRQPQRRYAVGRERRPAEPSRPGLPNQPLRDISAAPGELLHRPRRNRSRRPTSSRCAPRKGRMRLMTAKDPGSAPPAYRSGLAPASRGELPAREPARRRSLMWEPISPPSATSMCMMVISSHIAISARPLFTGCYLDMWLYQTTGGIGEIDFGEYFWPVCRQQYDDL